MTADDGLTKVLQCAAAALDKKAVDEQLRKHGHRPTAIEGMSRGQWVLMDYGDIIVHVFYKPVREFYDLERLWEHAPQVPLPEPLRSQELGFSSTTAAV